MPPKQVYGKKAANKTITTYAKLVSPDKDDLSAGKQSKNAAKKIIPEVRDDVAVIEQALVAIHLRESGEIKPEERPQKRRGRSQKEVEGENAGPSEELIANLEKGLEGLTVRKGREVSKRKPKPRRAVEKTKETPETEEEVVGTGEKPTKDVIVGDETRSHEPNPRRARKDIHAGEVREKRIRPQKAVETKKAPETINEDAKIDATHRKQTTKSQKHPIVLIPSSIARDQKHTENAKFTPTPPTKMMSLPTPEPTPPPENEYTAYVSALLSLSYDHKIISFEQWSAALEPHCKITKIAEASFSEVYRLTATATSSGPNNESVLKLVALRTPPETPLHVPVKPGQSRQPDHKVKKEMEARAEEEQWKSRVEDVHSEVKLLQNLNYIPGFTNFRELTVLQGRPSSAFADAWKKWNRLRPRGKKSEFPDPGKKLSYDDTQLWAVIEMQDAGTDLEKVMEGGGISTVWEVWDVFWGVCLSVAKAEEACKFEHRDLHLENICIRTSQPDAELTEPLMKDTLRRKLGFTGLETTVIDYTLSRADILPSPPRRRSSSSSLSESSDSSVSTPQSSFAEPDVAYLDLNKDMGLFTGDASEEYQYDIYRYMRGAVFYGDPLKSRPPNNNSDPSTPRRSPRKTMRNLQIEEDTPRRSPRKSMTNRYCDPPSDIWKHFHPKTNLVWAHFILYKLLEHLEGNEPTNLSSKAIMRNVEAEKEDATRVRMKACKLYKVLERVAELLQPSVLAGKESLGSMKELVVLAMEKRWLRVEDVSA